MAPSAKPVLGVISCNRQVEGEPAATVKARYLEAVARHADAVPLICPSIDGLEDAAILIERLDGLLLTGSNSNIGFARYGARDGRGPFDAGRDAMSSALIHAAMAVGKPVFGVCRGLQEINVALGGTLVDQRDEDGGFLAHHAPEGVDLADMFGHSHDVDLVPGTPLATAMGDATLTINSVHYQSIGRLAAGLEVNARAADGAIEAVSSAAGASPILAVQWHPEWRTEERAHDLTFWRAVGQIARAGMMR